MVLVSTLDKTEQRSAEATGHPVECEEPIPGRIQERGGASVTITSDGASGQLTTRDSAELYFESHAHSYNQDIGCHDSSAHTITPDSIDSSVTIDGSPVYIVQDDIATDPISGGSVNIVDAPTNNSVEIT